MKGQIFAPANYPWAGSHAQVPTPLVLTDRIRVYYADRFDDGRSFTTFVDLDRSDPSRTLYYHKRPILPFGAPGAFDDDGVMPSFAIKQGGEVWLYYSGWNRGVTVPYRNSVGIARSDDDGVTFSRLFEGPVLERNPREPYIAVTPSIVRDGDIWRMWYISGLRWEHVEERYEPVYVIKSAVSDDGIDWHRPNIQCIPQDHPEQAFSHPTVIRTATGWHMWYCFRDSRDYRDGSGAYQIGYAFSADGDHWDRRDGFGGLSIGVAGWASTMTSYPFVTEIDNQVVMFFNGNGFGRSGFGWAVWEGAL